MAILEIKNLMKSFDKTEVLKDVSFSMEPGEILGLVGESGSGKTVTAMCISGLLPRQRAAVQGSIHLAGREILRCTEQNEYYLKTQ